MAWIIAGSGAGPCPRLRLAQVGGVEGGFESWMSAAQSVDHLFRPLEVVLAALQVPLGGRPVGDVPQVADLVGQLDELRARAQARGVLDLQPLAVGLGEI